MLPFTVLPRRRVSVDLARAYLASKGVPITKIDSFIESHFIATGLLNPSTDWDIIKPGVDQIRRWEVIANPLKDCFEDPIDPYIDEFGSPLCIGDVHETETRRFDATPRRMTPRHSMMS
jgi:hypothetical protein